ncbi:hypothetical protein AE1304_40830 [Aeromonas enteropelogenes]
MENQQHPSKTKGACMKSVINQNTPQRLTRREAAAYLGLSEKTLGVWASNGRYEIPYYKLGNRTLYERADLDAFLASRKMLHSSKPANPIQ